MNSLSDQQKGSLMAFVAVLFITPDSLYKCKFDNLIVVRTFSSALGV